MMMMMMLMLLLLLLLPLLLLGCTPSAAQLQINKKAFLGRSAPILNSSSVMAWILMCSGSAPLCLDADRGLEARQCRLTLCQALCRLAQHRLALSPALCQLLVSAFQDFQTCERVPRMIREILTLLGNKPGCIRRRHHINSMRPAAGSGFLLVAAAHGLVDPCDAARLLLDAAAHATLRRLGCVAGRAAAAAARRHGRQCVRRHRGGRSVLAVMWAAVGRRAGDVLILFVVPGVYIVSTIIADPFFVVVGLKVTFVRLPAT